MSLTKQQEAIFPAQVRLLAIWLSVLLCLFQMYFWINAQQQQLTLQSTLLLAATTIIILAINSFRISTLLLSLLIVWLFFDWLYNYGVVAFSLPFVAVLLAFDAGLCLFSANRKSDLVQSSLAVLTLLSLILATKHQHGANWQDILTLGKFSPLSFATAYIVYTYCRVKNFTMAESTLLKTTVILLLLCAFFCQVTKFEYFYFFASKPHFTLHPEFLLALYSVLLFFCCALVLHLLYRRRNRFIAVFALLLSVFVIACFVPQYQLPLDWNNGAIDDLYKISHLKFFGEPIAWQSKILQTYSYFKAGQYPVPTYQLLILQGGWFLLIAALLLLLAATYEMLLKRRFLAALILPASIFALSLYFPLLSDPIGFIAVLLLIHLIIRSPDADALILPRYGYERMLSRVISCAACFLLSYFCWQSYLAYSDLKVNSSSSNLDLEFKLPWHFTEQLLVNEDVTFFDHFGLDFARIKWAIRDTLKTRKIDKGASTISMQLVKVRHLEFDKTISRKIRQVLIALYYEATLSKEEILKQYLASIGFANGSQGIVNAARNIYFKSPADLSPQESLLLVLSIPDPVTFNATMPIGERQQTLMKSLRERMAAFHKLLKNKIMAMHLTVHD